MKTRLFVFAVPFVLAACGGSASNKSGGTTPSTNSATSSKTEGKSAMAAPHVDPNLIARKTFFENPTRAMPMLSPDGKNIAFLAEKAGVLNVYVAPSDKPDQAKPITDDKTRGVRGFSWSETSTHILYGQDKGGDENFHVHATDIKTGVTKDLTPIDGVRAELAGISKKIPNEIVVGLNDRDKKYHDLYRVNFVTGERKLLQKNESYAGFVVGDDFKVKLAMKPTPDGGMDVMQPNAKGEFTKFGVVPMEDSLTTHYVDFDKSETTVFGVDSRGRDTAALVAVDLKTKQSKVIAEDPKSDATEIVIHPTEKKVQAVSFNFEKPTWKVLDPTVQGDFDYLATVEKGSFSVISRTTDDKWWTVAYNNSDSPVKFYKYDRGAKKASFLFSNRKELEDKKLAKMHPQVIKSKDGMDLVSYLTLPVASDADGDGHPDKPLPMVLLVHGGPWGRDMYGYNGQHQWLASRGYAVLSVNFRGSTGFGKKFVNAGNMEWAGKMHDDLIDAVNWATDQKIADKSKVAIMGGSYGGYSTLVGLTFTPDTFACGVDIVGPSNLETLLNSIPPYWAPMIEQFAKRVGDHRTEAGKKILAERSPITHVAAIKRPLLIGQGANDPRVKQAESDQIVKAMKEKNLPVTYVLYPDEGHGFARPENRLSFNAVAETFLSQCVGGSYQPVGGDFANSTITVPNGAEVVFGLTEALKK